AAASFQIAVAVWETDNCVCVADINPLRVGSWRIEVDAKGLAQARRKYAGLFRLALRGYSAKNFDISRAAFRQENVAVRRCTDQPGIVQLSGKQLDFESGWRFGPRVPGTRNYIRTIVHRLCRKRLRQVGDGDLAEHSRLLGLITRKRRMTSEDVRSRGLAGKAKGESHQAQDHRQQNRSSFHVPPRHPLLIPCIQEMQSLSLPEWDALTLPSLFGFISLSWMIGD